MSNYEASEVLAAFVSVARPILLAFLRSNSCIESTRVTIEVLEEFGIQASAQPVKWAVSRKDIKMAYGSGCSEEELSTAAKTTKLNVRRGWDGHCVAVTELIHGHHVFIDAAFDQCFETLQMKPKTDGEDGSLILMFELPEGADPSTMAMEAEARIEGYQVQIQYIATEDWSFYYTEAWRDGIIGMLKRRIVKRINRQLAQKEGA
jgi:hypothetical protein